MTLHAITRAPSPNLAACELTHLERTPIDAKRAATEHEAYEQVLEDLGCTVESLPAEPDLPDSVFVEDTAVVLPELAVITRPGAASRRPETESIARALARYRPLHHIAEPGTLDGGDVLRIDRRLLVGLTSRSNAEAVEQLQGILEPFGYSVEGVEVHGCLHLKSAASWLGGDAVLLNPDWVDETLFEGLRCLHVDPDEPHAANVLQVGGTLACPAASVRTRERLERHGYEVRAVDITELAKAEAGMTCSSLIFQAG
ncbi:MAG TPA: N(G),N(G)-dimethylarginine dimethylaminohydrolase [Arenicellales bacterium]|nr:N(G),N(G)-dimethylarginine dimethylaminohydrolase [Arenicellales bacterium]